MKQFSFSLQKLLGYKEQVLEAERIVLGDMNVVLAGLLTEREEMSRQRGTRQELLRQLCAAGISAMEMEAHKNFLTALDFTIRQKGQQIALQRQAIARQTEKVRQAKLELSTMEKLRERKQEEYNYLLQQEEERFIEEYVTTAKELFLFSINISNRKEE